MKNKNGLTGKVKCCQTTWMFSLGSQFAPQSPKRVMFVLIESVCDIFSMPPVLGNTVSHRG